MPVEQHTMIHPVTETRPSLYAIPLKRQSESSPKPSRAKCKVREKRLREESKKRSIEDDGSGLFAARAGAVLAAVACYPSVRSS